MKAHGTRIVGLGMGLLMLITPVLVFAQAPLSGGESRGGGGAPLSGGGGTSGGTQDVTLRNPLGDSTNSLSVLVKKLINVLIQIGLIVAVLAFLWAGFQYITAFGDPGKIKEAHKMFLYTVIGTAVLLGAAVIAEVIEATVKALQ